ALSPEIESADRQPCRHSDKQNNHCGDARCDEARLQTLDELGFRGKLRVPLQCESFGRERNVWIRTEGYDNDDRQWGEQEYVHQHDEHPKEDRSDAGTATECQLLRSHDEKPIFRMIAM